jgi:predicted nucleic acid-binding protein
MREAILDANILLRFLTDEPRDLADRVAGILEQAEESGIALIVPPLIFAEVVYVLESVYRWPRADIAQRLIDLIGASVLVVLEEPTIVQTLAWYRDRSRLDFADAYVAALATERGHGVVISFDRDLKRLPEITLVQNQRDISGNSS